MKQASLLLYGLSGGILMMFIYDLLRIWRRVVAHGTVWIAVEDIIYWCGCAVGFFLMLYQQNDGLVRGFIMAAVLVGMVVYLKTISRFVLSGGVWILKGIVKMIAWPAGLMIRPFRWGIGKAASNIKRKKKKTERISKKRLKKLFKAVKMGLCKL